MVCDFMSVYNRIAITLALPDLSYSLRFRKHVLTWVLGWSAPKLASVFKKLKMPVGCRKLYDRCSVSWSLFLILLSLIGKNPRLSFLLEEYSECDPYVLYIGDYPLTILKTSVSQFTPHKPRSAILVSLETTKPTTSPMTNILSWYVF